MKETEVGLDFTGVSEMAPQDRTSAQVHVIAERKNMNGSPKVLNIVHTHTHTHINKNKIIPFMSRGADSLQMLAGNQQILGAAQFLRLSLVCNNCEHQNLQTQRCCSYKIIETKTRAKNLGEG